MRNSITLLSVTTTLTLGFLIASTKGNAVSFGISFSKPQQPEPKMMLIGFNGFRGPRPRDEVQASRWGELGAVFYVTDSIDLARDFSKKGLAGEGNKDWICLVSAEKKSWDQQSKLWLSPEIVDGYHGRESELDKKWSRSVLFAEHANPLMLSGIPLGGRGQPPEKMYQMGIRANEIKTLGVKAYCTESKTFGDDHTMMNYPNLKRAWNIRDAVQPVAGVFWEKWRSFRGTLRWGRD